MADPAPEYKTSATAAEWEATTLAKSLDRLPKRQDEFPTLSQLPIKDLYTAEDVKDVEDAWSSLQSEV